MQQTRFDFQKHMQHTRFFVSTTLIDAQHTSIYGVQSRSADTLSPYLRLHAHSANITENTYE